MGALAEELTHHRGIFPVCGHSCWAGGGMQPSAAQKAQGNNKEGSKVKGRAWRTGAGEGAVKGVDEGSDGKEDEEDLGGIWEVAVGRGTQRATKPCDLGKIQTCQYVGSCH